jgi:hypothetical protein
MLFRNIAMAAGAAMLALGSPVSLPVFAAAPSKMGKPTAKAKPNVNRPAPKGGGGNKNAGNRANATSANYNRSNNNRSNNNRPNNNRPGGSNNNIGNTVVVAPPRGGGYNSGYYNNGSYNQGRDWEDDDDDFLEFVGKTAAITAGVSVVAAVIGSTVNEKPSGCTEQMSNGQVYLNCNGTWYQPVQSGSNTNYTVVQPPR